MCVNVHEEKWLLYIWPSNGTSDLPCCSIEPACMCIPLWPFQAAFIIDCFCVFAGSPAVLSTRLQLCRGLWMWDEPCRVIVSKPSATLSLQFNSSVSGHSCPLPGRPRLSCYCMVEGWIQIVRPCLYLLLHRGPTMTQTISVSTYNSAFEAVLLTFCGSWQEFIWQARKPQMSPIIWVSGPLSQQEMFLRWLPDRVCVYVKNSDGAMWIAGLFFLFLNLDLSLPFA